MTSIEFWSLVMDSLSTILAAAAIFLYIIFWYKDKTSNDYDVFDNLYLDLLKTGMEHPKFRDISKTVNYKSEFSDEELIQYEIYAFITWNFIRLEFTNLQKKSFLKTLDDGKVQTVYLL